MLICNKFVQFVNVVYYTDRFADIKESLHSWDKAHLVMVLKFLRTDVFQTQNVLGFKKVTS